MLGPGKEAKVGMDEHETDVLCGVRVYRGYSCALTSVAVHLRKTSGSIAELELTVLTGEKKKWERCSFKTYRVATVLKVQSLGHIAMSKQAIHKNNHHCI